MELKQSVNKVYKPLFQNDSRYIVIMGGRGAGRSTVASQYANAMLVAPEYFRCAIMRLILGDIRSSIFQEIIDRAEENKIKSALKINESLMTIQYGRNTIQAKGFKKSSGEQKSKLKSLANFNCVIIEEADEVSEADFIQLDDSLRTVKGDIKIILLLNPPAKTHWIVQRWFDLEPAEVPEFYIPKPKKGVKNSTIIRTSFLDNLANLSEQSIYNYKNYEHTKPDHYYNMVMGYVPETVLGKIFSNWREIDTVPHEARLVRRGLDFGYTNDPTALVDIYEYNGGYILDQQLYHKKMSNKQIADTILSLPDPQILVVGDSAEPKSIDEIKSYGVNIIGAEKGPGSINTGISFVQSQSISYTKRSKKIKEEYENYAWIIDRDGNVLNTPKPGYDHAMDAVRYGFSTLRAPEDEDPVDDPSLLPPEPEPLYPSIGI